MAVASGGSGVAFDISGIRTADIHDGPECPESFFFFFNGTEGSECCGIGITFCVFVFGHDRHLQSKVLTTHWRV
jgi:hypothetical protein